MLGLQVAFQRRIGRRGGLDQQHDLRLCLHARLTWVVGAGFPAENGRHRREDIDARGEPGADDAVGQAPRGLRSIHRGENDQLSAVAHRAFPHAKEAGF